MKTRREENAGAEEQPSVNVVLAYDTERTRNAILDMFDHISNQLRDRSLFHVNAFKFGLLERMDPVKWKGMGAGAMELAMVAFGEDAIPGADLLRWLETWAKRHAGQDSALGFLPMGPMAGQSVSRFARSLKDIAARHGLRFILGGEGQFETVQAGLTVVA